MMAKQITQTVLTATVGIEVPFHDIDSMNICWHGHYVKYFEIARSALLRSFEYDAMRLSNYLWPVVECRLKYLRPARYGQLLDVSAKLVEYESRLKIGYLITDRESGAQLTKGYTIQVAVDAQTQALQFVLPRELLDKLEPMLSAVC